MRYIPIGFIAMFFIAIPSNSQSKLLESVKRNPAEAKRLCQEFRELNQKGISSSSEIAIKQISSKRNLSEIDSEILSIYVIGLHCPDVK